MTDNPYRRLPAVDELAARLGEDLPRPLRIGLARETLDRARVEISVDGETDVDRIARTLQRDLAIERGIRIINASGILLHTNIGRATWSDRAIARAGEAAKDPRNLELDVTTGERSRRGAYVSRLLAELTGAESTVVVNNNASALLLTLAAVAAGRSVPVSRGELIEIGGSYRLPDVMQASGGRLVEVGTTNRTRVDDYRTAIQLYECGAILKIHPSNYRIEGFTQEASVADLAGLGLPVLYDLGSGLIDSAAAWVPTWLRDEPAARQILEAGADLVMFSGDKLLGGPQAGIIVGEAGLIDRVRSHPLARALRVDGVVLGALAATLEAYLEGRPEEIPFWRQALADTDRLRERSATLAGALGGEVEDGESRVGAGSAPGVAVPSPVVRLPDADHVFSSLLGQKPAILGRRDGGDLVLDLRAVDPKDDTFIVKAVNQCR